MDKPTQSTASVPPLRYPSAVLPIPRPLFRLLADFPSPAIYKRVYVSKSLWIASLTASCFCGFFSLYNASDWLGRRKPLVVFGNALSAPVKALFPISGLVSTALSTRVIDRLGKGIRDAPRDGFLADMITSDVRGSGYP